MKHFRNLFEPRSETGGALVGGNPNPPEIVPAAPVAGEPPPAAAVVLSATISERETNLQAELAATQDKLARTDGEKKAREVRIAELEDQLRAARQEPPTAPKRSKLTFFDED